ncbi:MAG TPA: TonB-dependent receptor [Vicinamibacterales bacterium]|nr:TonB-dependent receptor [Vicinamibacterales bacterium]
MRCITAALALLVLMSAPAIAQVQNGTLTGVAKDQQGAALPGATATLTGVDATRTFVTDTSGAFRFLELAPGPYKLSVSLQGFQTVVRDNLIVEVGKNVDVALTLKVAAVAETVNVVAATPLIDARQTGTATNITDDELRHVPTSRDPFALMRSVPGVLVDRVNVGGNETGQQSSFVMKGTRPQDAVWTLDGVVVTDMTLAGSAPTYFNFDNFQEIQVSTSGQDITQPTGGLGMNFVVKRGTNLFHGAFRGYFANEGLQATNVPSELAATGVTSATADHVDRLSDYGFELGGPIVKDRAWFYGSYSYQDIRLFYHTTPGVADRTELKNPNVKVNWQATKKDLVNFLYFDGYKIKDNRSPGTVGVINNAPTATFHQDNAYSDGKLHGLWKFEDNRVLNANNFVSAKYAYYNTGFILTPEGGMGLNAGRDLVTGTSYGSITQSTNIRPQHTVNADASSFFNGLGGSHDLKYGFGFRRTDGTTLTDWPGNGILALRQTPTLGFAELFRSGNGTNRADYLDFYAGDTFAVNRATINLGLRYDRQWGAALASSTAGNPAFPTVLPGFSFAGYSSPYTWNDLSPRAGITYALDDAGKTLLKASFSRYASQQATGTIGYANSAANAGFAVYLWNDLNADHFASPDEVNFSRLIASGSGFNPANPTAITSANQIDPNLKAPMTTSIVAGVEHELRPNLAVEADYTYTRVSDLFGNLFANITPRVGVRPGVNGDYTKGAGLSGTLPDGTPYNIATYIPVPALVTAGGGGFLETNIPGYYTDNHGIELAITRRLTGKWMGRLSLAFNDAREHFTNANGVYDTNGNPTPTITEPLVDGGAYAPQSTGNGEGAIYMNARWQFNADGMYIAPYGIELAANVFGRQGYPEPLYRPGTSAALGSDSTLNILVSPTIDYVRYPSVWDTDFRVARDFKISTVTVRGMFDVFNLFNANTVLLRNGNVTATGASGFNAIAQNLSPLIARVGVQIGF